MRMAGVFLVAASILAATAAQAGSIQVLEALNAPGPSMIALGAQSGEVARPSMIALGEPAVTDEQVSSIGKPASHRRPLQPAVIRGGVVGGASATVASR